MIVVDASAMVAAVAGAAPGGEAARSALRDPSRHAPHVIDLEVASALRAHVARGLTSPCAAAAALRDAGDYPMVRHPHLPLMDRVWQLRENVTPYDAAYVSLAELLGAVLVTVDARLATAPGVRCAVHVVRA